MATSRKCIFANVLRYYLFSLVFAVFNVQAQTDMALEQFNWRMGDTWRYDYLINGKNASETWKVTNLTSDGVTISPAGETFRHDVLVARDGELKQSISPYTKERIVYESYHSIRFPVTQGKTWTSDATLNGENFNIRGKFEWRAIGWEKVTVPAGDFQALRVEMTSTFKGATKQGMSIAGTSKETRWYANETRSWVKWEASDSLGRSLSMVLTKFSSGN
jgi:hypothetical protein